MFKYILLAVLVLHCNCQKVIELKGNTFGQSLSTSNWPARTLSGYTGLGSLGSLGSFGGYSNLGSFGGYRSAVQPYSYALNSLSNYGLGYGAVGGIRNLGYQSLNYAPATYGYQQVHQVAVQPQYQTVQVQQPAITIAQPAAIAIAKPVVQTVAIQPQVYAHQQAVHPVSAAIHQIGRTVEYKPIPYNDQPITPQVVDVEPSDQPIHIHFKSRSSTVRLSQEHQAGEPGTIEQTSSQDEPSKVVHEVVKPVIQEVREVIQPYRQLTQEIQPVVENVHTVVSQGEGHRQQYVVEPQIIRQQLQTVQQVVPQVQQIQVPRPVQIQQVEAQPIQYQTVVQQVPQYQHVQTVQQVVPQQVQYQQLHAVQPVQTIQTIAQPQAFGIRAYAQPQTYGLNVNRVIGVQQPLGFRTELKEHLSGAKLFTDLSQQKDFNRVYAESD